MKKYIRYIVAVIAVIAICQTVAIAKGPSHKIGGSKLAYGEVEVLYEFPDPGPALWSSTEGVACDRKGNLFVSLRTMDLTVAPLPQYIHNEIVRISPSGEETVLVDLGVDESGWAGVLGLTTDPQGNVYAAFLSANENHGVWKVDPDGNAERLAGSEYMISPNALTFDSQGNLYVSDSFAGLIWKYGKETKDFAIWSSDPLLGSDALNPMTGDPMPGVNGLAFSPPDNLYFANTGDSRISHIPILPDGSAGPASVVAEGGLIINPDDVAVDTEGNLYTVIPIAGSIVFGMTEFSPVVKIYPDTSAVEPVVMPYNFLHPLTESFDFPTSLCFGAGPLDKKSVFVINMSARVYFMPPGTGPKLTQVGVGVPGRTGQ